MRVVFNFSSHFSRRSHDDYDDDDDDDDTTAAATVGCRPRRQRHLARLRHGRGGRHVAFGRGAVLQRRRLEYVAVIVLFIIFIIIIIIYVARESS